MGDTMMRSIGCKVGVMALPLFRVRYRLRYARSLTPSGTGAESVAEDILKGHPRKHDFVMAGR